MPAESPAEKPQADWPVTTEADPLRVYCSNPVCGGVDVHPHYHRRPDTSAAHRPERYYGECRGCVHPDDLPENLSDDLEALAAEYESDYYDTHFSVGEDSIVACEPSFDGYGCPACADEANDYFRAWTDCPWYDPDAPLPASCWDDPPTVPEGLMTNV